MGEYSVLINGMDFWNYNMSETEESAVKKIEQEIEMLGNEYKIDQWWTIRFVYAKQYGYIFMEEQDRGMSYMLSGFPTRNKRLALLLVLYYRLCWTDKKTFNIILSKMGLNSRLSLEAI